MNIKKSIFRDSIFMKFANNLLWYIGNKADKFHKEP